MQASYDVIRCILEVYKQLGFGLPEYIYQEALTKQLIKQGLTVHKEVQFHPEFKSRPNKPQPLSYGFVTAALEGE